MIKEQSREHFRDALAQAIAETIEFPRGVFVTLTDANIRSNQKEAMGLLSVFPSERRNEALQTLKKFRRDLKNALARSLKLRSIPDIEWKIDEREEYVGHIDEAINQLKAKGEL